MRPVRPGALLCFLVMAEPALAESVIHVSPRGKDERAEIGVSRAGSYGPLRSPQAALDLARRIRTTRSAERIRISLAGGSYTLTRPLVLAPQDSGLVLEAEKGARPLLVGGIRLTGWRREDERLWSAPAPNLPDGLRLLVVNGAMRPRARIPETGYLTHETTFDVPWMSTTGGGWKRKPTDSELTTLRYRAGDLGPWLDVRSAELTVFHMWDESVVGVKAHDPGSRIVTFSTPAGHPPGAFGVNRYVVWNVKEGLRAPGQWYLDRSAGRVYYWPRRGENMSRADVRAPTIESVIRLEGTRQSPVRGVTIRGLSITLTNTPLRAGGFGAGSFDGAVSLNQTQDCVLEDLTIHNVAGWGIRAIASPDLRVEACEVREAGAGGVRVDSPDGTISDCYIHHIGRIYPSGIGLWISGPRLAAIHNEIHDAPYSGIVGAGDDSRIERNLIYRVMQELHDGGGIYVGFCKRVAVRGNVIRDVIDTGGYGASAYYLDEQAEGCLVEGNLSLRVARPSHNHMARKNVIRNNVFCVDGDARLSFQKCEGYVVEANVIQATGRILFQAPVQGIESMPRNILQSQAGVIEVERYQDYSSAGKAPLAPIEGTLFADPGLRDPARGDCRFTPSSPAPALGIQSIEPAMAGRRQRRRKGDAISRPAAPAPPP